MQPSFFFAQSIEHSRHTQPGKATQAETICRQCWRLWARQGKETRDITSIILKAAYVQKGKPGVLVFDGTKESTRTFLESARGEILRFLEVFRQRQPEHGLICRVKVCAISISTMSIPFRWMPRLALHKQDQVYSRLTIWTVWPWFSKNAVWSLGLELEWVWRKDSVHSGWVIWTKISKRSVLYGCFFSFRYTEARFNPTLACNQGAVTAQLCLDYS
jgi:hypothetical protein